MQYSTSSPSFAREDGRLTSSNTNKSVVDASDISENGTIIVVASFLLSTCSVEISPNAHLCLYCFLSIFRLKFVPVYPHLFTIIIVLWVRKEVQLVKQSCWPKNRPAANNLATRARAKSTLESRTIRRGTQKLGGTTREDSST